MVFCFFLKFKSSYPQVCGFFSCSVRVCGIDWHKVGESGILTNQDNFYKNFMIIGQYEHKIDDKKRLSVPTKWKKIFGKSLVVTRGLDTCLFLYTKKEWEKIAEKLANSSLGSKDARDLNRFFLSGAVEIELDSAGRILVPDYLKDFAKLEEKIIFAGLYSRAEIWNLKEWEKKQNEVSGKADDLATKLQEIGMI
jgi:MraZ protein